MSATNPNIPESQVKDRQLAREVEELLARDADVNATDITVQARGSIVMLTGTVDTLREKERAEALAKKPQGVHFVENYLVIGVDEPLKDPEISARLDEALGNFPEYDPAAVGVRLNEDGVVYLTGTVVSASEKMQAERIASGVKGVRQVVNEIEVAPGEPVDDITLHNLVVDALSDDPRIDPFSINVEVKNGDVSFTGDVQDQEAKDAVTERASEVPGVKGVFNGLKTRESQ